MRATLPLILLGFCCAVSLEAQCPATRFGGEPHWVSSGAWSPSRDTETLLLGDAQSRQILRYSKEGRFLGPLASSVGSTLQGLSPLVIKPTGAGFMLEIANNGFLALDQSLSRLTKKTVAGRPGADNRSMQGVFLWQPAGGDLVTFSDLQGPGEGLRAWSSAFTRLSVEQPRRFKILATPLDFHDPEKTFYRLGHPYIASLGPTAYVLRMTTPMAIFSSRQATPELRFMANAFPSEKVHPKGKAFPDEMKRRESPILPSFVTRDDLLPLMRTVEESTLPTGLYGWENALFVLWRTPDPKTKKTDWFLTKINPATEEAIGTVQVPSHAHHLTVVPGAKQWAFVEKGPVHGFGDQRIDRIFMVPAQQLRGNLSVKLCR